MLFLFDMDNVLYDYHWRVRMHGLTDLTGLDFHELRRRWWHDEGEWKAEKGDPPTGSEYLTRVNSALEADLTVDQWLHHRRLAMTPRQDIIDVAARAAELGSVAVLTNNGALIGEHLRTIAPELVPIFGDHLYATAHFRARKPEPDVFRNALDALGHRAGDTLFVDDMPENVRGAETLGITGEWFSPNYPATQLLDVVERFAQSKS
jgi:putative hydrolase of the HAD superfamily